ncbi:MAG: hypothetical protein ABWZ98_18550 [Nakamurella sp.]
MTDERPAAVDAVPASPRDTGYRSNQLPAGVTMVQIKRRYAAIRIRPSGIGLRTEAGGGWASWTIASVARARRPWVLKVELSDGSRVFVRPFMAGEAGLPDCGGRVGGIGSSEPLGDDPISAVIAIFAIVFYVLAAPFFVYSNWKRSKAAGRLQAALRATVPPSP